jgi:hypothetical protein
MGDAQFFGAVWLLQRRKRALEKVNVWFQGKKGFDPSGLSNAACRNRGPEDLWVNRQRGRSWRPRALLILCSQCQVGKWTCAAFVESV